MFLEDQIDWSAYLSPEWSSPSLVPQLLKEIRDLTGNGSFSSASLPERFRNAVGNDHSGTVFPIALPAITCLVSLLYQTEKPFTQRCILGLFLDLPCFFVETETFTLPNGQQIELRTAINNAFQSAIPRIQDLQSSDHPNVSELAHAVLSVLAEREEAPRSEETLAPLA
jgi:hypothetical protein